MEGKKYLLVVGGNQLVSVFDIYTGATLLKLQRDGRVRCVALANDGSVLVVGGFDRKVVLHAVDEGAHLYAFAPNTVGVVRSVHLSSDSSRLSVGSEVAGAGRAYIYDTADGTQPLHQFDHPKAVWCVRLSPPATMMAVAGYDMALTLYDVTRAGQPDGSCPVLQKVTYTSKIGPAFIWSAEFSEDGEAVILGCWSGFAFVYTIDFERAKQVAAAAFLSNGADSIRTDSSTAEGNSPSRASEQKPTEFITEPAVLTQAAEMARGERVYAVDSNSDATRLVVGGRDKKVAMFDTERHIADAHAGSVRTDAPPMLWEVLAEDFVYTCSLSADFQYCVYGGTDRKVVVLNAQNGRSLFQIPCPGTVWTVTLLGGEQSKEMGSCRLAIGGEFETVEVYNVETCSLELQLPVDEVIYEIALSAEALCFSHGRRCSLYGNGGAQYSWQDMPSYAVVSELIKKQLGKPEELIKTLTIILDRHPSVVNAHDPRTGSSLLQMVTEKCNVPQVLELLMQADCHVGLQQNFVGMTAMHAALYHSKWSALRQLYQALLDGRFMATPGTMQLVAECLPQMASSYPREFLQFVSRMPLQAAPELLGGKDTHSVMIPHMLVCGSDQRCPHDVWEPALHKYTRKEQGSIIDELLKGSSREEAKKSSESSMPEGFCRTTRGNLQAFRVPFDGFAHLATIELLVDAVTATKDYGVFGSKPLEVLLTFKWQRYSGRAFVRGLISYALYLSLATAYNIEASRMVRRSGADLYANGHIANQWYLFGGWVLTTLVSLTSVAGQLRKMIRTCSREKGRKIDYKHLLALFNHVLQLVINLLFWLRDWLPSLMTAPTHADGSGFGLFLTLQSWAVVLHFARMVFVLRGFLEFGSLVHMVEAIVIQMLPFMLLLALLVLGFTFSMHLLLQHTEQGTSEFDDEQLSLFNVVNMGFRFVPPNPSLMRSYWQVVFLYEIFMMLVQIVMLNLLIAFMAQLLGKLRINAQLMAHFERAILIIEQEQNLHSRRNFEQRRAQRQNQRDMRTWLEDTQRAVGELIPWLMLPSQEDVGPHWLHVLLPSESLSDDKDSAAPIPPPKATEEKHGNDELKQWMAVQLGRLEARMLEQINNRESPLPIRRRPAER